MPASARHRFPRSARLVRTRDIEALLRRGRKIRTRHLDIFVSASPAARVRVGLVVPRYQFTIVQRNRLKRRLREAVRLELLPRCGQSVEVDILLRARREAYGATHRVLAAEIAHSAETLCSIES